MFAGTINADGAIEVEATKTFADNTLSKIIHMVEEAQEQKGKSQRFIERFGRRYSPAVLGVGILMAVIPPLVFAQAWTTWIAKATVFVVAAAPCALAISIPITLVAALGTGARNGVLIKGGIYLEELAKVKVVALDKTGTITRGEPEVTDVVPAPGAPADWQRVVAGIERRSQHPLARAVLRHAEEQGITAADVTDFKSLTGAGAVGRAGDREVYVGSPELFKDQLKAELHGLEATIAGMQEEGKTVIVVGDAHSAWGLIGIRDNIRENARQAIADLRKAGVEKVVMLTGDNERTARAIAGEVGIDEFYAHLKPEDKVTRVRELTQRVGHVAMVGDGVNDAPALAEATVGVAMGTAGTDVALETADVALMADDLNKLVYALKLAKRNQSVVNQNLALSALVIGVLVVGAVAGAFSLPIAVLGHEISEFIVIASGLRMLRG
ncbi:putative cadmium-transporting ATPase [compost metagenome]